MAEAQDDFDMTQFLISQDASTARAFAAVASRRAFVASMS